MISLRLRGADLARVRFGFSPLWECVAAFRAWSRVPRDPALAPWLEAVDPLVAGRRWPRLDALAHSPTGIIPDFVAPPPEGPTARFGDELASLRSLPPRLVLDELALAYRGQVPQGLPRHPRGVPSFLGEVAADLEEFWRLALAPIWSRVESLLESEILVRARRLGAEGPGPVLRRLHPDVRFRAQGSGGVLTIRSIQHYERRAGGAGVLLIPSVFSWPETYLVGRLPWRPTLAYPAQAVATAWDRPSASASARLASLLGSSRARLLQLLQRPHSTLELSGLLSRSPAAISEQLRVLEQAGVVQHTRVGRRVFYSLNAAGTGVLQALERPGQ